MRSRSFASVLFVLVSTAFFPVAQADTSTPAATAPAADSAPAPATAPATATDSATAPAPATAPATDSAPAPVADSAPAPAPNLGEAPPTKGAPRLHIEADRPGVKLLRIERTIADEMGEGNLVRTACDAPCDRVVDGRKKQTFFLAAEGMVPSRGFQLSSLDGDVDLRLRGGSFVARQLGYLFGGFGGVGLLGGAVMLGFGYAGGGTISGDGKVQAGENTNLQTVGWVTLGAGAALAVTGVVLVLTSKTSVEIVQGNAKTAGVRLEMGRISF